MKNKQDFDPFAPANHVNPVEVSPFVFSRIVSKIESNREEEFMNKAKEGWSAKNMAASINATWIIATVVMVFLEVIVIRVELQRPRANEVGCSPFLGDFVNQSEQIYDHEN